MDNFDLKKYLAEGKLYKVGLLTEELNMGDTIEINPKAFPGFEFPYGTKGKVVSTDKADYASDDLVYTVKIKHIDSQGYESEILHVENSNQMLEEINQENDFSDIDIDMGKDKETFMDSVDSIIESLYNQGGYRNISFIKEYLKHLIDIS